MTQPGAEQADEAERKWRLGLKLKATPPAPFPPAYP